MMRSVVQTIILLLAIFLLCGVAGAMDLYFSNDDVNVPGFGGKLMEKRMGSNEVTLTLGANKNIKWFSQPMKQDVLFSAGKWKVNYWAYSKEKRWVYVRLYKWSSSGLILLASGHNVLYPNEIRYKTLDFDLDSLALKRGERICVEINWSQNAGSKLELYYNSVTHPSGLKTPDYTTFNQIPEFSPQALVVAVALIIGGFAISRKD